MGVANVCFFMNFAHEKISLEVEGGTWVKGRHTRPKGYANDCEKYSEAAIADWMIIRATSGMIKNGKAIELVEKALGVFG